MPNSPQPREPEILAFHQRCASFYPADAVHADVVQQRAWYDALCAAFDVPLPHGLRACDASVQGRIAVRRYTPAAVRCSSLLLYLHGGGFVLGSLASHHAICAEIAEAAQAELVAVDYRLAPEHVWPAAFEDAWAVLHALLQEGRPLILIGDSAGGNLAAGLALKARDLGLAGIAAQVLIYPGLGGDLVSGSYVEMATAPGLTTADVAYYQTLLQAPADQPYAFPLRARDFAQLPPAYISAAYYDPLRDDARQYAAKLISAGVTVAYREEPQMLHAWLRARGMSPGARAGFAALCHAVRRFGLDAS